MSFINQKNKLQKLENDIKNASNLKNEFKKNNGLYNSNNAYVKNTPLTILDNVLCNNSYHQIITFENLSDEIIAKSNIVTFFKLDDNEYNSANIGRVVFNTSQPFTSWKHVSDNVYNFIVYHEGYNAYIDDGENISLNLYLTLKIYFNNEMVYSKQSRGF